MDQEFVPLDAFQRTFKYWWVIALLAVAGGLFGYAFHRFFPPEYDAVARFEGPIDFPQIDTETSFRYPRVRTALMLLKTPKSVKTCILW